MDDLPVDAFLADYPDGIREITQELRRLVTRTVPNAVERVRPGWRLIGYDVPVGRRSRYFGYVAPEPEHLHLGFEYGASMADPDRMLEGAHLALRQVRFVTFRPGDPIPEARLADLVREAVRVATMSPAERASVALDRDLAGIQTDRISRG